MKPPTKWTPPFALRAACVLGKLVVRWFARFEVSSDVQEVTPGTILAANHISPFDPLAVGFGCLQLDVAPRFMAMQELFRAPIVGSFMRAAAQIRVNRGELTASHAIDEAEAALRAGAIVIVFPEGRISKDPGLWLERGKTGVARMALNTGAQVIPVSVWGSHEVLPYEAPKGMWPWLWRNLRNRPLVKVHFGHPVDLSDLDPAVHGSANKATDRIIEAIIKELTPLRADEPGIPRNMEPGRPVETRRSFKMPGDKLAG